MSDHSQEEKERRERCEYLIRQLWYDLEGHDLQQVEAAKLLREVADAINASRTTYQNRLCLEATFADPMLTISLHYGEPHKGTRVQVEANGSLELRSNGNTLCASWDPKSLTYKARVDDETSSSAVESALKYLLLEMKERALRAR